MKIGLGKKLLFVACLFLMAFLPADKKKVTVWLIGDSTMSIKDEHLYPETGWGMPFVHFFDSTVTIENRAMNGRSTKTFLTEKRWQPVVSGLKEGDYVFIQFGHNDEVATKASYTTEAEFRTNLTRYVIESRGKKAIPILLTPVARRKFDSTGKVVGTHDVYAAIVRSVAKDNNVPLIDLEVKGQALYQEMGVEASKHLFNHLARNQHPNYPEGKIDDTHFNEYGARRVAEIVLADVKSLKLDLANRIKKREKK
jgi:lysophospholipase L1-like esterase